MQYKKSKEMRRLSGRWSEYHVKEGGPCRRDRPEEMREMAWRQEESPTLYRSGSSIDTLRYT